MQQTGTQRFDRHPGAATDGTHPFAETLVTVAAAVCRLFQPRTAATWSIKRADEKGIEMCRQRVIADLAEARLVFAKRKRSMTSRFFDLEGREVIRGSGNAGRPVVVPVSRDGDPRGAEAAAEPRRRRGGPRWQG